MPRAWKYYIDLHDVWQDETFDFELRREKIVGRFTPLANHDEEIIDLLHELRYTENEDEFDMVWDEIYDWADRERVWIELWSPVTVPVEEDLKRLLTELKGPQ